MVGGGLREGWLKREVISSSAGKLLEGAYVGMARQSKVGKTRGQNIRIGK